MTVVSGSCLDGLSVFTDQCVAVSHVSLCIRRAPTLSVLIRNLNRRDLGRDKSFTGILTLINTIPRKRASVPTFQLIRLH